LNPTPVVPDDQADRAYRLAVDQISRGVTTFASAIAGFSAQFESHRSRSAARANDRPSPGFSTARQDLGGRRTRKRLQTSVRQRDIFHAVAPDFHY
jgi:hypothetical protein